MEFMKKMDEFSKKVGRTATDTYNTVADKSGKLIEEAKLKMAVNDKHEEIEDYYIVMGKTVYEQYKDKNDVGEFTKVCKKIDKLSSEINEMEKKILFNKNLRKCDNCGEIISLDSTFCENCGKKQKPVKIKEDKKELKDKDEKEEPKEKVCPQCGLVCDYKSKFCSKCGYKF